MDMLLSPKSDQGNQLNVENYKNFDEMEKDIDIK